MNLTAHLQVHTTKILWKLRDFGIKMTGGHTDDEYAAALEAEHRAALRRQPGRKVGNVQINLTHVPHLAAGGPIIPPPGGLGAAAVVGEGIGHHLVNEARLLRLGVRG